MVPENSFENFCGEENGRPGKRKARKIREQQRIAESSGVSRKRECCDLKITDVRVCYT